jgi:drug/metabolite transporter (DMT)-like permease
MIAPQPRPVLAVFWMAGSILAFTAMAVAARQIKGMHDTFEIMTARSLVGFLLVLGVAGSLGRLSEVKTSRLPNHLWRNAIHFAGQNLWLLALTLIPLAQVFAVEFTSPIWVILLSPLLLGERITKMRLLAAAFGFLGILIVARPDFSALDPGLIAAFACAICFALTGVATKRLTRYESIVSILFWLTLMQFFMGAVLAGYDGLVHWPTSASAPWLVLIGFCGLIAHLCLTSALQLAPASFVMPIDFARLPLIAVIGATFYNEPIDALVFVGAGLIVFGNWLNIRSEQPKRVLT